MPSHQQNLDAVRIACNEVLVKNRAAAEVNRIFLEVGRSAYDPSLCHVLLAIGEMRAKPSEDGIARALTIDLKGGELFIYQSNSVVGEAWWDLRQNLSGQSEATVSYLATLLKDND